MKALLFNLSYSSTREPLGFFYPSKKFLKENCYSNVRSKRKRGGGMCWVL